MASPKVILVFGFKSRVHLDAVVADGEFPAPIKIGKRAVAWLEPELKSFVARRIAERDSRGSVPSPPVEQQDGEVGPGLIVATECQLAEATA